MGVCTSADFPPIEKSNSVLDYPYPDEEEQLDQPLPFLYASYAVKGMYHAYPINQHVPQPRLSLRVLFDMRNRWLTELPPSLSSRVPPFNVQWSSLLLHRLELLLLLNRHFAPSLGAFIFAVFDYSSPPTSSRLPPNTVTTSPLAEPTRADKRLSKRIEGSAPLDVLAASSHYVPYTSAYGDLATAVSVGEASLVHFLYLLRGSSIARSGPALSAGGTAGPCKTAYAVIRDVHRPPGSSLASTHIEIVGVCHTRPRRKVVPRAGYCEVPLRTITFSEVAEAGLANMVVNGVVCDGVTDVVEDEREAAAAALRQYEGLSNEFYALLAASSSFNAVKDVVMGTW